MLSRTNRTFYVANRMLRLAAGPGLKLTSPVPSRCSPIDHLIVGLERVINNNVRLKHRLRLGRNDNERCLLSGKKVPRWWSIVLKRVACTGQIRHFLTPRTEESRNKRMITIMVTHSKCYGVIPSAYKVDV